MLHDNVFMTKRTAIKVAGITAGYTDNILTYIVDTGERHPVKVAGITADYKPIKVFIDLLNLNDFKY